jgi:microsomal prostaglandin-E synthase 2
MLFSLRSPQYGLTHTRLKKRHNITDERAALYEEVGKWTSALGNRKFMGGELPNLADVAFFGVLRAVKGFDTYRDVMEHTKLLPWIERMEAAVGPSSRVVVDLVSS